MKRVIENKKGLSAVVTNLIIILLVIVAVGIIWVVFQNLAGDVKSGINFDKITVGTEINKVTVNEGSNVSIQVHRKSGEGNLTGLNFLVYNSAGNSESFDVSTDMDELATRTFTVDYTGSVSKVEVAPILELDSGKSEVQEIQDTYEVE